MPRSYFRTLPDLYERKAFGTEAHPPYPPAALACFIGVLCFGEQQPDRGRFKSRRLLTVLLEGPRGQGRAIARQVAFLVEHGDLIERPDGSLYIEGWDELQEGDWQVTERMTRYRRRRDGVTVDVTEPTVTPLSRVEAKAVSGKRLAPTARPARDRFKDPLLEEIRAAQIGLYGNGNETPIVSPTPIPTAAEQEREARRLEALALHERFLNGEIGPGEYERLRADIGKQPDDLTRVEA